MNQQYLPVTSLKVIKSAQVFFRFQFRPWCLHDSDSPSTLDYKNDCRWWLLAVARQTQWPTYWPAWYWPALVHSQGFSFQTWFLITLIWSHTCQFVISFVTTVNIHYSFSLPLQAQNLSFPHILSFVVLLPFHPPTVGAQKRKIAVFRLKVHFTWTKCILQSFFMWILYCQRQSCKAFTGLSIRAEMVRGGRRLLREILFRNWLTLFKKCRFPLDFRS